MKTMIELRAEDLAVREHLNDFPSQSQTYRTTCPLCSPERTKHKEKILSVRMDGTVAVWNCHHCDAKGAVDLSDGYTPAFPPTPRRVEKQVPVGIYGVLNADQFSYLAGRGISQSTADRCGVVSHDVYISKRGQDVKCLGFPYVNEDGTTAVKWRDGSKNFSQSGAAKSLWRIKEFKEGDLVIAEGEIDALSFEEVGISAVSVPNGAPLKVADDFDKNSTKYSYLVDAIKYIKDASRVIIASDADDPGEALAEEIARRIGKSRCWRMVYPEGCKDANDILVKLGPDALRDALNDSTPWPIGGLRDASEYKEQAVALYRDGMSQAVSVKVGKLSEIYKPSPGTLTVATGIPGSGKSTFFTWLSYLLSDHFGWSCGVFSAETSSQIHLLELCSLHVGKPFMGAGKMTETELTDAIDWVNKRFIFIDESETTVESILERAQAAVLRRGIRVLMIDPFNFLSSGGTEENTNTVKTILIQLKSFAVEHDIAVWLIAHPRMMYKVNGKNSVPKGYDISGSANFFNVADNGITIERVSDEPLVSRIHSWKSRFPWIGSVGSVKLSFEPESGKFTNLKQWGDRPADWKTTKTIKI